MRYSWFKDGKQLSEAELAKFTAENAHQFYEKATCFTVREGDGYEGNGGTESVYREDAFQTASDHYKCDYDVFYDAWLDKKPVDMTQLMRQP